MSRRNKNLYAVGTTVFLQHPTVHGAWIKTDSSVALSACHYCGARKGELCLGANRRDRTGGTHSARRQSARLIRSRLRQQRPVSKTILHLEVK